MKNMRKWILEITAALLLCALLAGCGGTPPPAAGGSAAWDAGATQEGAPDSPEQEDEISVPGSSAGSSGQETAGSAADPTTEAVPTQGTKQPAGSAGKTTAASPSRATTRPASSSSSAAAKPTTQAPSPTTAAPTTKPTAKPTTKPATGSSTGFQAAFEEEVVALVNQERAARGLAALSLHSPLRETARLRSQEIVEVFSHTRPNGKDCFTAFPSGLSRKAENIAYGYPTPEKVVEGWMNSDGHRANILDANLRYIGVGCYKANGTYYWVQAFGS